MRRLFISASNHPKSRKPLRVFIITMAVVIVALIGCDQAIGSLLDNVVHDTPQILPGPERQAASVENFWRVIDAGLTPIIFAGDSQIQRGFSPHLFDDTVKQLSDKSITSLTVSFQGSGTVIMQAMIKNLLLPAKPPLIIYAIEMRIFNQASDKYNDQFRASLLGDVLSQPPGFTQAIQLFLTRHSGLIRYQLNIQNWFTQGTIERITPAVDDRGFMIWPGEPNRTPDVITTDFTPFAPDDAHTRAFNDILSSCQKAKTPCVVMNMPLHELAYQYITPQDEAAYLALIQAASKTYNVPIWDFDTPACKLVLSDDSYFDLNHLNQIIGMPKFTRMVAALYAQQIVGTSIASDDPSQCAKITTP